VDYPIANVDLMSLFHPFGRGPFSLSHHQDRVLNVNNVFIPAVYPLVVFILVHSSPFLIKQTTSDVVYFTVSRRPFYRQEIGQLFW